MSAASVVQLRALLSEKFPGLRMHLDESPRPANASIYPTALPQLDGPLQGGLPKGAITEIIAGGPACGSATLMRALLQQSAQANQISAFIDGTNSLEVSQFPERTLLRLLWIRCPTANEAMKAADLVLRDGNLGLVLLDLKLNPEKELRKIPPTTWHRLQRLVEQTAAVCLVFTPRPLVARAQARIVLRSRLSLDTVDGGAGNILDQLKLDVVHSRHCRETSSATAFA